MLYRSSLRTIGLSIALVITIGGGAFAEPNFPDWSGRWLREPAVNPFNNPARYDPIKPLRQQEAPLKPEYRALAEASWRDQDAGGFGLDTTYKCAPQIMPRLMNGVTPMEFLFFPEITHILFDRMFFQGRHIYTDGRDWPKNLEPTSTGYSIGKWLDTDGDGRFDMLEIETRSIRGPKTWDGSGMPMADDDEAVVKERLYLDKNNPDHLRDEMTTTDNSLTRPWSAMTTYRRYRNSEWSEDSCLNNVYVTIEKQVYMLGADDKLMPIRKDQPPPDLRYFKQSQK